MTYKQQLDSALAEIKTVTTDKDQKADTIRVLEGLVTELRQDNKRYAEINRDLNVRAEGIRTVTVNEKVSSGRRGRVPDAAPHARTSANYDAFLAHFNVNGLSHGKIANTSCDVLKYNISPSGSYRSKIRTSKALEPDHDSIKKKDNERAGPQLR